VAQARVPQPGRLDTLDGRYDPGCSSQSSLGEHHPAAFVPNVSIEPPAPISALPVWLVEWLCSFITPWTEIAGDYATGSTFSPLIRSWQGYYPVFAIRFIRKTVGPNRGVLQDGIPAQARIVSVRQTGVMLNNQPQIAFELEVQPPGGAP